MKTNVSITLTDEQRSTLADLIDGKQSKRLATRAEITAACHRFINLVTSPQIEIAARALVEDWPEFNAYLLETCAAVFNQGDRQ